jgi:hypothetical protein
LEIRPFHLDKGSRPAQAPERQLSFVNQSDFDRPAYLDVRSADADAIAVNVIRRIAREWITTHYDPTAVFLTQRVSTSPRRPYAILAANRPLDATIRGRLDTGGRKVAYRLILHIEDVGDDQTVYTVKHWWTSDERIVAPARARVKQRDRSGSTRPRVMKERSAPLLQELLAGNTPEECAAAFKPAKPLLIYRNLIDESSSHIYDVRALAQDPRDHFCNLKFDREKVCREVRIVEFVPWNAR